MRLSLISSSRVLFPSEKANSIHTTSISIFILTAFSCRESEDKGDLARKVYQSGFSGETEPILIFKVFFVHVYRWLLD